MQIQRWLTLGVYMGGGGRGQCPPPDLYRGSGDVYALGGLWGEGGRSPLEYWGDVPPGEKSGARKKREQLELHLLAL